MCGGSQFSATLIRIVTPLSVHVKGFLRTQQKVSCMGVGGLFPDNVRIFIPCIIAALYSFIYIVLCIAMCISACI